MADNTQLPGTKIAATDEVTFSGDTAQVQVLRPAHVTGAEGAKTVQDVTQSTGSAVPAAALAIGVTDGTNLRHLRGDSTGRIDVVPTPSIVRVAVTPTISTGVYTSGDVIGGLQTVANAVRASGGTGTVLSITVIDKTQAQRAAIDLLFFDRTVTVAADNAAVAMSDADMSNCLGIVSIGPYNTVWPGTPLNSVSALFNVGLPYVLNGTDLFVVCVVRATPTYVATSDLEFKYVLLRD